MHLGVRIEVLDVGLAIAIRQTFDLVDIEDGVPAAHCCIWISRPWAPAFSACRRGCITMKAATIPHSGSPTAITSSGCWNWPESLMQTSPKHVARLDANALAAWAAELDGAGALGIGFGGGEPTLYPGFAALCRRIHAETDLALSVTTHGHRWTEAFAASVGDALQFVRVSMDGVGDTYARLRGRPFDLFAERLAVITGHYRFGINVVVNADTLGEFDAIADYA
jgi:hypothetical protein